MTEHAGVLPDYWSYPLNGEFVSSFMVQVPGCDFSHEVRVCLPPSYRHTERTYPTLWVTDNTLEIAAAALTGSSLGDAPELIVVSIGFLCDTPMLEWLRRRTYDFSPPFDQIPPELGHYYDADAVGGAPALRDFLIDELRPRLAEKYRMDADDHGLAGHSGGGAFGLFALLTRPAGFAKYLIGSPGAVCDFHRLEAEYAAGHADLEARVFIGVGEAEISEYWMAAAQIWTTTARIAEALTTRGYPSLELATAVLPGLTHYSAWPGVYVRGVRALWREHVRPLGKADLGAMIDGLPWMSRP